MFTLTVAASILSLGAVAQAPLKMPSAADYVQHVQKKKTPIADKSIMVMNSRLIAYRYDDYDNNDWVSSDSSHLTYTGTRGGEYYNPYGYDFDTETGYTWNGSAWENNILSEKTYDANNRMLSFTYQFWDGTAWEGNDRDFYTYDANGRVATYIAEHWDFGNGNWVPSIKHIYTYDANGNMLVDEEQQWNTGSSTWRPYMKRITTYNASSQLITELDQEYAGGYFDRFRTTFTYATSGILEAVLFEEYNTLSSVWEPKDRNAYTYNAANQVLTMTLERYLSGAWTGHQRYTYVYNAQGHQTSETYEQFASGAYQNETKVELTVDGNGYATQAISYEWDGSVWQNFTKSVYGYDAAGNVTLHNYFDWDAGAWEERFRETTTYNSYNQIVSDTIMRDFFNGIVTPDSREYYYYEAYEDGTSGIGSTPTLLSSVMPNPFTINVAIQVVAEQAGEHTFEVYNVAGQLVHSQSQHWAAGQQTIVFDGQQLPKGMYYYRVGSQNGVASGKLVKQ